ncbi:MAG: hypothetical protein KAH96_02975 [Alphaproteobacteria bacterium]|nr:hypothetical protein [Alphaproteobacteria bacterium]
MKNGAKKAFTKVVTENPKATNGAVLVTAAVSLAVIYNNLDTLNDIGSTFLSGFTQPVIPEITPPSVDIANLKEACSGCGVEGGDIVNSFTAIVGGINEVPLNTSADYQNCVDRGFHTLGNVINQKNDLPVIPYKIG